MIRGVDRELDQCAIEGVRNSWVFLPATKNGEVLEESIVVEIDFPETKKKR